MSNVPNFIVFMWLFPVVSSIIIPLAMLGVWLSQRGIKSVLGGIKARTKPVVNINGQSA